MAGRVKAGSACRYDKSTRTENVNGEIRGLTISDPPTQAEAQALRDACEELAVDVRTLGTLVHALRGVLIDEGAVKGGAGLFAIAPQPLLNRFSA
jgi:hypothetical protein